MSKSTVKKVEEGRLLESGLSSPAIESTFYSLGASDDVGRVWRQRPRSQVQVFP